LQLSLTFLNPGDGVLIPNPGYPTYASASRLAQARIHTYDLTEENGWKPDFDALERMDLTGVKLMWANYPHMPTGTPATKEVFERLIDFGLRHGIVIAHDNPYSFILNDRPLSIMQTPRAKEIAIELNSLSKSHNMAGWRMAMLTSNPTFVGWVLKVKSNIDSGQFRPMMMAAARALEAPQQWYDSVNATYAGRRVIAEQIMDALGCRFDPAQRGLFLWGRIPDDEPSSEAMADRLLYEAGVFITPGFIFGSNGERYIRISLCATEENLRRALQRITLHNQQRNK
ncbi:MAG: aminotransferase class I/II-fold pyridoxal phosphate-dependent enzyme, partial [Paramuribaculum sp.]